MSIVFYLLAYLSFLGNSSSLKYISSSSNGISLNSKLMSWLGAAIGPVLLDVVFVALFFSDFSFDEDLLVLVYLGFYVLTGAIICLDKRFDLAC